MALRPIAGAASLTVDGVPYNCTESSFRVNTFKAETMKGQTAVEGYSEMPAEGYIAATVRLQPGQSSADLINARGSTVVLERRSGQIVYGYGMWQTEEAATTTVEGTMPIKFEGGLVTEQVATS